MSREQRIRQAWRRSRHMFNWEMRDRWDAHLDPEEVIPMYSEPITARGQSSLERVTFQCQKIYYGHPNRYHFHVTCEGFAMNPRYIFAGIGSRETPQTVRLQMIEVAKQLRERGWWLRSGGAAGADRAFQRPYGTEQCEIFYASDAPSHQSWFPHAQKYHPAWGKLHPYHKELHARNSPIVLGARLDMPVDFILCWTKDGGATGGTGQALRIAADLKIPVFNMFFGSWRDQLHAWIKERI